MDPDCKARVGRGIVADLRASSAAADVVAAFEADGTGAQPVVDESKTQAALAEQRQRAGHASLAGWLRGTIGKWLGVALLLVVLLASGTYGGDLLGIRQHVQPPPEPKSPLAHGVTAPGEQAVLASQPWWQPVTTLQGTASMTPTVTIGGAIQWRLTWSCEAGGRFRAKLLGGSASIASKALVDEGCPGQGIAYSTHTGSVPLEVIASGPWRLQIEQQVDVPFVEPALPAMNAPGAVALSTGTFYDIGQRGHGTVTIYRLADGSHALRLDNFYVTPNSELEIRLSVRAAPHSDGDVTAAEVATVAALPTTAGSMNFAVPHDVDPTRFQSVVIWCRTVQTVYSGATLKALP